jgi:lipopolysaccharide/colanic/teichoic acid biosynthesis glycosyltransferase
LASIRLRNEEELYRGVEDPEAMYRAFTQPEKIRLGLEYVANHSFFGDLSILLATMRAMFEVRGAPSYVTKELIKSGSQSTEA